MNEIQVTTEVMRQLLPQLRDVVNRYRSDLSSAAYLLQAKGFIPGKDALTGDATLVLRGEALERLQVMCMYVEALGQLDRAEDALTTVVNRLENKEGKEDETQSERQ